MDRPDAVGALAGSRRIAATDHRRGQRDRGTVDQQRGGRGTADTAGQGHAVQAESGAGAVDVGRQRGATGGRLVTPDGGQTGDGGRRGDVVGDDRRRHPRRRVVGTGHHRGRTGTREVGRVPAPHVDSGSHGERRVAALGRPDLVAAGRHGPFQAVADRRARLGRGSARGRVRPGGADQDDSAEVAHDLDHHRLGVGRTGVGGHDQAGGVCARVGVHVGRFGSVRAATVAEAPAVAGDGPARLGAAQSGERHGERRRPRGRISHDHRRGRRVHSGGRTRSRRWGTRPGQQHDGADDDDDRGRSDAHWLPRFAHGAVRGVPPRPSARPCHVHHPGRGATL